MSSCVTCLRTIAAIFSLSTPTGFVTDTPSFWKIFTWAFETFAFFSDREAVCLFPLASPSGSRKPLASPEAPEAPEAPEPYGLIDEYVDDLLGIPPEERPSWQRPSWHQTGSSMDVPEMVLQDGSRAPALPAENRALQTPTPYLEGVLNGWAAIDRPVESEVREPAPKRRADRPS